MKLTGEYIENIHNDVFNDQHVITNISVDHVLNI